MYLGVKPGDKEVYHQHDSWGACGITDLIYLFIILFDLFIIYLSIYSFENTNIQLQFRINIEALRVACKTL